MQTIGLQVKRTLTDQYDVVTWVITIFLGGTINMGFLNAAYLYIMHNYYPELLFQGLTPLLVTIIFVVLAAIMPLLLSLLLSAVQPKLKIVPPFFITIISFAWLFVLWVTPNNISNVVTVLTVGTFYCALGFGEDYVTTLILGIATDRENIYFQHVRAYANLDEVKNRLLTPEIRHSLTISEGCEGDSEKGYLFKTAKSYSMKNDIYISKDKDYPEFTSVKLVYYETGKYSLRTSLDFIEESRKTARYIEDVFASHDPKIPVEIIVPLTNQVIDRVVDRVIDDMKGYYSRSKQYSTSDKFTIGLAISILVLTGSLFLIGEPIYAGLSIAIEVLIAVLGLPSILRKQRD